jgi:hypothetical protein
LPGTLPAPPGAYTTAHRQQQGSKGHEVEDKVVRRHADRLHEHIAELEVEQKSQRTGEDAKPQPAYTLMLKECLLCVSCHSLLAFLLNSPLENARHYIQHGIDRHPDRRHKIPERCTVADIQEHVVCHLASERNHHEQNGFYHLGHKIKGMQS